MREMTWKIPIVICMPSKLHSTCLLQGAAKNLDRIPGCVTCVCVVQVSSEMVKNILATQLYIFPFSPPRIKDRTQRLYILHECCCRSVSLLSAVMSNVTTRHKMRNTKSIVSRKARSLKRMILFSCLWTLKVFRT